jgi:hypothetical protein
MRWPFVTRRRHLAAIKRMAGYVQALTTENDQLRDQVERLQSLVREDSDAQRRLEVEMQFRDERIRRALALSVFDGVREEKVSFEK